MQCSAVQSELRMRIFWGRIRRKFGAISEIRSKKSGDNYVLEAPRTGKIAWSSCLQSLARLGCSILLRFHSNPPDSRAYWYKSVTNSWDFRKVVREGSSYISPTGKLRTFWAFSECFYHLLRIRSNLRNSELIRGSGPYSNCRTTRSCIIGIMD